MIKKQKKTRLDFNNLYELYKLQDKEQWRTLLYENMDRFLTATRINLDYSLSYWYDDIKQDLFLYIDERISKSVEKWFDAKQAFNYVKCRTRNTILNILNPTRGWNQIKYFQQYGDDLISEVESFNEMSWVDENTVIDEAIIDLNDLHKSIILLKYRGNENTLQEISKYLGKNLYDITLEHAEALHQIRKRVWMAWEWFSEKEKKESWLIKEKRSIDKEELFK